MEDVIKRVSLINSFDYKNYPALVKTEIYKEGSSYIYKQKFYKTKKLNSNLLKKSDFFVLAESLEYINSLGFVHGDLNKKNIIYTDDGFKVIDYEPSLMQIKDGKKQLIVTIPYVVKDELQSLKITTKTDKVGFFYFILRATGMLSPMAIAKLSKSLNHKKLSKHNIDSLNYLALVEMAFEYKNLKVE